MRASLAGWMFAAPALIVLGVFFFLPVGAALALSLTDFDLYALADPSQLRFVALGNYLDLLRTPLFWKALGNTFYFVLVGVPLSILLDAARELFARRDYRATTTREIAEAAGVCGRWSVRKPHHGRLTRGQRVAGPRCVVRRHRVARSQRIVLRQRTVCPCKGKERQAAGCQRHRHGSA